MGPHSHHKTRPLPFPPGLQTPDHTCEPTAWGWVVGAGLVFGFSPPPLTNDFKLSRDKLAPLLFLTVVKLSFFVNAVSSVAGRNRLALVRLCAFFVPPVPELCSGRLAKTLGLQFAPPAAWLGPAARRAAFPCRGYGGHRRANPGEFRACSRLADYRAASPHHHHHHSPAGS